MAQTIGYQRGRIPGIQANETAPTTAIQNLFTNSGSTPMRVILCSFETKMDTTQTFILSQIGVKQNGSTTDITCAQYKYTGGSGGSTFTTQTIYSGGTSGNGTGNQSTAVASGGITNRVELVVSRTDSSSMNWNASGQLLFYGSATSGLGNGMAAEVTPPFIWLLPGDILCCRTYGPNGGNATFTYSFITITDTGS